MELTKEQTIKALECCIDGDTCSVCLLHDIHACEDEIYKNALRYLKENEPAPSANGTSSEVSSNDTNNISHLDDNTSERICQVLECASAACSSIIGMYEGMSEEEQRAFDLGESYGKMDIVKLELEKLKGGDSNEH